MKNNQNQSILSEEDEALISLIKSLPDQEIDPINCYQEKEIEQKKYLWQWIGFRFDYLQRRQLGFKLQDPCESPLLKAAQARQIEVMSEVLFSFLQVLVGSPLEQVSGFSLVKDAALATERSFPFKNERELVAQVCREWANGWSENIEGAERVNNLKGSLRKESAFLRGRLEAGEEREILESLKISDDWYYFCFFAVFPRQFQKPLLNQWKEFLKAHKQLVSFIHNPPPGIGLVLPGRDKDGRPLNPKTRQLLEYEEM